MALGKTNPFTLNPFKTNPFALVEFAPLPIPPAPETHEPRRPLRSYLAGQGGSDAIATALSPLLPGAPRPSRKIEVERIREVERPEAPSEAPAASSADDGTTTDRSSMPKWGGR